MARYNLFGFGKKGKQKDNIEENKNNQNIQTTDAFDPTEPMSEDEVSDTVNDKTLESPICSSDSSLPVPPPKQTETDDITFEPTPSELPTRITGSILPVPPPKQTETDDITFEPTPSELPTRITGSIIPVPPPTKSADDSRKTTYQPPNKFNGQGNKDEDIENIVFDPKQYRRIIPSDNSAISTTAHADIFEMEEDRFNKKASELKGNNGQVGQEGEESRGSDSVDTQSPPIPASAPGGWHNYRTSSNDTLLAIRNSVEQLTLEENEISTKNNTPAQLGFDSAQTKVYMSRANPQPPMNKINEGSERLETSSRSDSSSEFGVNSDLQQDILASMREREIKNHQHQDNPHNRRTNPNNGRDGGGGRGGGR